MRTYNKPEIKLTNYNLDSKAICATDEKSLIATEKPSFKPILDGGISIFK